jgi:hypothetical protein
MPPPSGQDPNAKVFGPADWGWYFSALTVAAGPDCAAHGNLDFLDWYLKQVADYMSRAGSSRGPWTCTTTRKPMESPFRATIRRGPALWLRTVKSLYDPAYLDESWINDMGMGSNG